MKSTEEKLVFIVVTYNRSSTLERCLLSILAQRSACHFAVIVVDNNSIDTTESVVSKFVNRFPHVIQYIKLTENIGGAGGFEFGCKEAYRQGFQRFFLLDDDVMLGPGCMTNIMRYFSHPCLIAVREDTNGNLAEYGALRFNFSNPLCINPKRSTIATTFKKRSDLPEFLSVDSGSFEGFIVHRSVIDRIGFPNKEFFIFGDDTDFSLRIKRAGFEILAIRDARIIRQLPFNRYVTTPWKTYFRWRNFFVLHFLYGENVLVKAKPFFLAIGLGLTCLVKRNRTNPLKVLLDSVALYRTIKKKKKFFS